jgi:ABC-type phosphate/phosphonate transport system substrate-binding protein
MKTFLLVLVSFFFVDTLCYAEVFKIGIMQPQRNDAAKFQPLLAFFKKANVDVKFVEFLDFGEAAHQFSVGGVDAMFAASGVAAIMMIKELADPLVRPVYAEGWSTYWTTIIAKQGSPEMTDAASYLKGKRIAGTSLASSGEFYIKSILGPTAEFKKTRSHVAALDALSAGMVDIAIVKNRVWDATKEKYKKLALVGQDKGEHPNETLIVSRKVKKETSDKIKSLLVAIGKDNSAEAEAVKKNLKAKEFVETTEKDFAHTMSLVKGAGVTKDFVVTF